MVFCPLTIDRQDVSRILFVKGSADHRTAMLCAEKDPLTCHRGILISRHLQFSGIDPVHILEDGGIETQDDSVARLLRELDLDGGDLFRTREEIVSDAYEQRGREIAYREPEIEDAEAWR